jgi:hypothetical protein
MLRGPKHSKVEVVMPKEEDEEEANVYIGLYAREQRSPSFLHWCCSWMRLASPVRGFV